MNRIKLWIFTILVVVAGWIALRLVTVARHADSIAALDARLASAVAQVAASKRTVAHEASALAALVARDAKLAGALQAADVPAPPRGRKAAPAPAPADSQPEDEGVRDATRQALANAEGVLGFGLPDTAVVTAGHRAWLARKGEPADAEDDAAAFLRGAIAGQARRGLVRHDGALWYAAAVPSGDGAGVVVRVPLDETWASAIANAAGVDVTLSVPDAKPVSTARPAEVPFLAAATRLAGAGDVGPPTAVDVSVGPLKLPKLPHPVGSGAALRARAVALEGVSGGFAIVSVPASGAIRGPAAFYWYGAAALAFVLLVGLVLGLFVRSTDAIPQVPAALHAAAVRIESGDFAARAPALAGKLGTVAAALNRAAEVAGPAQAAQGAPAPPAGATGEWYQGPARAPAPDPAPEPFLPPRPAVAVAAGQGGRAAAALSAVPAPTSAAPEPDEDTQWQQVFQDFLRTRTSCGEPTEGLTYDKFRQKLESNKAQLVAKYACKSVRFQVYVKEGKAALKATPVK